MRVAVQDPVYVVDDLQAASAILAHRLAPFAGPLQRRTRTP
jgi:hypothetical protein